MSGDCFILLLSWVPLLGSSSPLWVGVSSQVLGFAIRNPQAQMVFREVPNLAVWEWKKVALTGLLPPAADVDP